MLTDARIRQLITEGENLEVEFKGELSSALNDRDLVEAVVCLANTRGGVLLIGVEDDGEVTGARPRHGAYTDVRRLEAMIGGRTVPGCAIECSVSTLDGLEIVVVDIAMARSVVATSDGVYKRRALDVQGKPQCLPFYAHEMQSREAARGALDYSALVLPDARWEDLDPLEFERLRQTIGRNRGRSDASLLELPDTEIVKALGLGEGDPRVERIRVAGLLLLGREESIRRLLPTHEVAFQVLRGSSVASNDFMRWPLVRISEEITARFDARNEEEELELGAVRIGIPDYSRQGFREAVHNALVHRDYARMGAVHVIWRNEEIEVTSPGGFPDDVRLSNLLVTAPRPRNPVLADAFKRIGLVERTGRGIDTIFEGQLRYGRPAPDYSRSSAAGVQVVLPGGPANLSLARFIIEHDSPDHPVTVEEMLIVNFIDRERRIDAAHAAELMQKDERSARALLERLVESGTLEARGELQRRVYMFSAATYRGVGRRAAHTRAMGFEPIQHEQMVLQYVRSNTQVTRSEAADLCQLTSDGAKRLLLRLTRQGRLVMRGTGRAAYYQAGPAFMDAPKESIKRSKGTSKGRPQVP